MPPDAAAACGPASTARAVPARRIAGRTNPRIRDAVRFRELGARPRTGVTLSRLSFGTARAVRSMRHPVRCPQPPPTAAVAARAMVRPPARRPCAGVRADVSSRGCAALAAAMTRRRPDLRPSGPGHGGHGMARARAPASATGRQPRRRRSLLLGGRQGCGHPGRTCGGSSPHARTWRVRWRSALPGRPGWHRCGSGTTSRAAPDGGRARRHSRRRHARRWSGYDSGRRSRVRPFDPGEEGSGAAYDVAVAKHVPA